MGHLNEGLYLKVRCISRNSVGGTPNLFPRLFVYINTPFSRYSIQKTLFETHLTD